MQQIQCMKRIMFFIGMETKFFHVKVAIRTNDYHHYPILLFIHIMKILFESHKHCLLLYEYSNIHEPIYDYPQLLALNKHYVHYIQCKMKSEGNCFIEFKFLSYEDAWKSFVSTIELIKFSKVYFMCLNPPHRH